MFSIYSVDTGKETEMSLEQCYKLFGELEFVEIAMGYLPHLVVGALDAKAWRYFEEIGAC